MIGAQILYDRLTAVCRQAGARLLRHSRAPLLFDERDYACGLLDAQHRLLAQVQGQPTHLAALHDSATAAVQHFAFDIADGDLLLVGDAHAGGSFGHVLSMVLPVFDPSAAAQERAVFFVVVRAAVADLGGERPGPLQPQARDIWQEGFRLTPVKLHASGRLRRDTLRLLLRNSRCGNAVQAQLQEMESVARHAAAQVQRLLAQCGLAALQQAVELRLAYGRRRLQQRLHPLRGRHGAARQHFDALGCSACIVLTLRVDDDGIVADFSGSSPCVPVPLNCTPALTAAMTASAVFGELLEQDGLDQSLLDALRLVVPPGLVAASAPAPVSLSGIYTGPLLAATVAAAWRQLQHDETVPVLPLAAPQPQAWLSAPLGRCSEDVPQLLAPGFARAGWGPTALAGTRRLASAELLERDAALRLQRREYDADGAMRVELRNLGPTREATLLALDPHALADAPTALWLDRDAVAQWHCGRFDSGQQLRFRYPPVAQESAHV
ncbi:hydantoinase B/oxoprolinase family protein [Xanthomonas bundabergensis]|uniref:hydantoinase B/oxoprolinase family protein n=1 Tax=Xanthomonas bundabergensis TaxID=3160842 RepID=UPI003516F1BA